MVVNIGAVGLLLPRSITEFFLSFSDAFAPVIETFSYGYSFPRFSFCQFGSTPNVRLEFTPVSE